MLLTQAPGLTQFTASMFTGLRLHKIQVKNRRVGGGFGGKVTRALLCTAGASVAALLTGRQVHVKLERFQDCMMVRARSRRVSNRGCRVVW